MSALVFVDTNVLVYWRDVSDAPKQSRATEWLDVLWREQRGRLSTQVLSEFYAVVTRKSSFRMPADEAWRDVLSFSAWKPQALNVAVLERAHAIERRHRISWWDSLIVAAAQAQGCAALLTEDLQDGAAFDDVVVRNPFTLGVAEERSAYASLPELASRHRGRGRPRTRPQQSRL